MSEGEELNPERIWLQPECCVSPMEGRQWCQDNVWPTDSDCDATGVEYVRADLARTPTATPSDEVMRLREALEKVANAVRLGAESDLLAWANLANACQQTARAALSAIEGEKK